MKGGSTTQSTAGCRNECSYISHHRNVKHYIIDNIHLYPSHVLVKPWRGRGRGESLGGSANRKYFREKSQNI